MKSTDKTEWEKIMDTANIRIAMQRWAKIRIEFEDLYGGSDTPAASRKTRDEYANRIREATKDLPIQILFGICMDSFGLYLEREKNLRQVSHVHDIFGKQIADKAMRDVFGPNATVIVVEGNAL